MSRIVPQSTGLSAPYWEGCNQGLLRLQRCEDCGQHQFYPRLFCSHCSGDSLQWVTASGRGTVASFTVVRRAVAPAYTAPYVVALVDLEEGSRMMSNIIDAQLEDIAVGSAVSVAFEAWTDEQSLPVFRLDEGGSSS